MPNFIKYLLIALIGISFIFCLSLPLQGELIIQTDIARDLLVLEEIVEKKSPTLIGAHSGIEGIFHGPMWFYINLPAFIIGGGNPAVVGLFWGVLYALTLCIIFYVAKKMFSIETALFSTALTGMIIVQEINNLSNPYGALMLFPLYLYFFYQYITHLQFKLLLVSFFILGLIIQFQMAFGVPILILTLMYLAVFLVKHHKPIHLIAIVALITTQLTFILFELRHDFFQIRSLINYLHSHSANMPSIINFTVLQNQFIRAVTEGLIFFTKENVLLNLILAVIIFFTAICVRKKKHLPKKIIYVLGLYFYFGYWVVVLFYSNTIWLYYHWAIVPVLIILFCSTYHLINKTLFTILFFVFISILFLQQVDRFIERNNYIGNSQASWNFFKSSVDQVYNDAKGDFGYYVDSDDELGYQAKYAFHYMQKFHQNKSFAYEKKNPTYVYIYTSSIASFNPDNWVRERVKIQSKPQTTFTFKNGITVNKYEPTEEELENPADPNLINSMIFR